MESLSKTELLAKCTTLGITKCKSKTKPELIALINSASLIKVIPLTVDKDKDDDEEEDNDSDSVSSDSTIEIECKKEFKIE